MEPKQRGREREGEQEGGRDGGIRVKKNKEKIQGVISLNLRLARRAFWSVSASVAVFSKRSPRAPFFHFVPYTKHIKSFNL